MRIQYESGVPGNDGGRRSLAEEAQEGWAESEPASPQDEDPNSSRELESDSYRIPVARDAERARQLLQLIVSNDYIFDRLLDHLYRDLVMERQREHAQAALRRLTLVQKAWVQAASRRLYKNPFLGTAERAESLAKCLEAYPERARLVRKLIFGEGSSADVKDWKSPSTVPRIINACQQFEIIGFDGLTGVDLQAFENALVSAPCLEEIRSCDLMPPAWTSVSYFFKNIVQRCQKVTRIRLYSILSELEANDTTSDTSADSSQRVYGHKPDDFPRGLVDVALNSCGISMPEINAIFAASKNTLRRLYIEYPSNLDRDELVEVIIRVGTNLQELVLIGFEEQYKDDEDPKPDYLVCQLLEACPDLRVFDFQEALASMLAFANLQKGRLDAYSFTCVDAIRPNDWLAHFETYCAPHNSRCRVLTPSWTEEDVAKVRLAAARVGLNWLSPNDDLLDD